MSDSEDFARVDIRTGKIIRAEDSGRHSCRLTIDFCGLGIKKPSARLCSNYTKEELIGRQVIAAVNLKPKQIGNFISECLVLGVPDSRGQCVLLKPDKEVDIGAKVY